MGDVAVTLRKTLERVKHLLELAAEPAGNTTCNATGSEFRSANLPIESQEGGHGHG